jgi:hypothetical protein
MVMQKDGITGITPKAGRKWRGDAEKVSPRGLPISREDLQSVLASSPSLRAAAIKLGCNHQTLMDIIRFDPFYRKLVEEAEERYAEFWPKSATERELMEYGWIHTLLNRRAREILAEQRWGKGDPLLVERRRLSEQLRALRGKLKHSRNRKLGQPEAVSKLEKAIDGVALELEALDLQLWPKSLEISRLFISTYPSDRWESLTLRRKLLLQSGIPKALRDQVQIEISALSGEG